jgi:hypothetical protein
MNNSKINKIDWINIVMFKTFQDYFNLKELQDLSMLSKITRSKLNPVLFKSIILYYLIDQDTDMPSETCNVKSFQELNRIAVGDEDEIENNLHIQNSLSNINSELQNIKHYINSTGKFNLERSGRYLYPIIANFSNLTVLKIYRSTIQYSIFQKLGEYFPMLKTFELCKVVLSKYSKSSNNSNEIIFPPSLTSLSIWHVDATDISILYDHYKSIVNNSSYYARSEYSLPNMHMPSLKNLKFLRCSSKDNELEEFLEMNPNLEHLSIDAFSPEMCKNFTSLKSLSLDQVDMFENLQNLTVLHNIKTLNICSDYEDNCENLEKLCLMCPSIESLEFSISNFGSYEESFDDYLVPILKKLPKLKTLELPIEAEEEYFEFIDINHFPQIEKIIFTTPNLSYLQIRFEKNYNLKEIDFISEFHDINKKDFLEKYGSYIDWEFKFYKRKIKGYKIH